MDKYSLLIMLVAFINMIYCANDYLSMDLTKKGFHRNIGYGLHFHKYPEDEFCEYVIVQMFTQDVYLNAHEIQHLEDFAYVKTYVPEYPDIEEYAITQYFFKLYIYGEVKGPTNITYPIHFRYQPPNKRNFIKSQVAAPKLYVACRSGDIVRRRLSFDLPSFDTYLLKPNSIWSRVEYSIQPMKLPFAHIPVGNKNFQQFVTIITIAVSWLACLYIITAITKKKSLDKKL